MAMFLMAIASAAPKSFNMAIMQTIWHPPIQKELGNFIDNTCFQWIKDIGKRRMMIIWLFSFKSDLSLKARLVVNGKMRKPGIDYCSLIPYLHVHTYVLLVRYKACRPLTLSRICTRIRVCVLHIH